MTGGHAAVRAGAGPLLRPAGAGDPPRVPARGPSPAPRPAGVSAPVNLHSDTQTRPTAGMRRAMAEAEVGDEQRRADPTVNALQERVAVLLGHEAGLFLPSGTMCNGIGFRLHLRPGGDEVLLRPDGPPGELRGRRAGRALRARWSAPWTGDGGVFGAADLRAALRPPGDRYAPRSRLVSVEQTTNLGGGRVWPLATVREVLGVAREAGLRAHLDGARLMNAVVASGVPASEWASGFDTAWLDLTKGLGAPVGAVLVGSRGPDRGGLALQADVGRRHAPGRHRGRRRPLRPGPPRRAAGRGPRQRPGPGRGPGRAARRGDRPGPGRDQHRRRSPCPTRRPSRAGWRDRGVDLIALDEPRRCARSPTWTSTAPGWTGRSSPPPPS